MPRPLNEDPFRAFNFRVSFERLDLVEIGLEGGFSEVTGLQAEVDVHEYREGGVNDYVHKLSGPTKYPSNLVLKRGLLNIGLLTWFRLVNEQAVPVPRLNLTIELLNTQRDLVMKWEFEKAYPVKWSGPELRADSNTVALETLELAHRGLVRFS